MKRELLDNGNIWRKGDGTIKSLTVKQVADLLGHTTSEICEMFL